MGDDPGGSGGHQGPIIDECLCFIMNKWSQIDVDTLIKLCVDTYHEKEIQASKDLLFSLICDKNAATTFIKRRGSKINVSRSVNNMRDMIQLLTEKGDIEMPIFVAKDLGKLPPITFDHLDVTVLLNKIQNIATEVRLVKGGMSEMCDTNKAINEKNTSYDGRIEKLENMFKELTMNDSDNLKVVIEPENKNENDNIEDCLKVIDNKINELPLSCTDCDLRFKDENVLKEHRLATHDLSKNIECDCVDCNNVTVTKAEVHDHVNRHKLFL